MPIRNAHRVGDWLMIDEESGHTVYRSECRKIWNSTFRRAKSFETRQPQEFIRAKNDPRALRDIRVEQKFATPNNTIPNTIGLTNILTKSGPASHLYEILSGLSISSSDHSQTVDNAAFNQAQAINGVDVEHAVSSDNPGFVIGFVEGGAELTHTHTIDNAALAQTQTFNGSEVTHSHGMDAVSILTQAMGSFTAYDSQSDSTIFTFSGHSIGAATNDRIVVLAVHVTDNNLRTISSVTVGGNAMTSRVQRTDGDQRVAIFTRNVSDTEVAGTTADIVVTLDDATDAVGIATFLVTGTGSSAVPHTTNSDSANDPLTANVSFPAGSVVIAAANSLDSEAEGQPTFTWTNVDESYDNTLDSSKFVTASGGIKEYTPAQENLTITGDPSVPGDETMVVAVFAPG